MNETKKEGIEKQDRRGLLDKVLSKVASRKLTVFAIATGLLAAGTLTSSDWILVALVYLGSQGLADIVATVKRG